MPSKLITAATLFVGMICATLTARSQDFGFTVNLNTQPIAGGTYYLDLSLSDGSVVSTGLPSTSNSLFISNFNLGGGTAGAVLPFYGDVGAGSSFATDVTLADGDPGGVADFAQGFTPGNSLSFSVRTTEVIDAGGVPDTFLVRLLDSGENVLATADPSSLNGLIDLNYTTTSFSPSSAGSYGTTDGSNVSAAEVDAITPEPRLLTILLSVATCGLVVSRRKRRQPAIDHHRVARQASFQLNRAASH